jgi:hypothetical protein
MKRFGHLNFGHCGLRLEDIPDLLALTLHFVPCFGIRISDLTRRR